MDRRMSYEAHKRNIRDKAKPGQNGSVPIEILKVLHVTSANSVSQQCTRQN